MSSTARTKSKKKAEASKAQKLQNVTARRMQIEDLRVGDRIVTSWRKKSEGNGPLTDDEVMNVGRGEDDDTRYVNTSKEIKQFDECPGKWRTHVHINRSDCYDMRGYVWIVNE